MPGGKGSPRRQLLWFTAVTVGGLLAVYLVVRGIVEFFVIDYSRLETYHDLPSIQGSVPPWPLRADARNNREIRTSDPLATAPGERPPPGPPADVVTTGRT